ncbi:MAG: FAD-dependent oxidoreductase, partial [Planctomycetota bacterium]
GLPAEEYSAQETKVDPCLCSPEFAGSIREDLKDGGKAVIAACSHREKAAAFTIPDRVVIRANLREGVAWTQEKGGEDTLMSAQDYLRMAIAQCQKTSVPEAFDEELTKTILVVGGGLSGLTAALEAADDGADVILVEKAAELGGWEARNFKQFPLVAPYRALTPPVTLGMIERVEKHERITVHTGTTVAETLGQPGQFDVTLTNGKTFRIGSIVQATGMKPYDPEKLDYLGYGRSADVVTGFEFEAMMRDGGLKRPSDGKAPKDVVFVQCAGSRDEDHLPYCSAVCCRGSLKQAMYVREADPEAKAIILYKDIRSPAQWEEFYKTVQQDPGVFFNKGEVTGVDVADDGKLLVKAENTLMGENIAVPADLVVLATGMVPVAADGEAIRAVTDANATIAKNESPVQVEAAQKIVDELGHHAGTEILNLNYRQGPDLPSLRYGFPDSHFICFPFETRRTGIYAAGAVRQPNDALGCSEDAQGAALKAIQALDVMDEGAAVHPRWGDLSFPDFFLQRCTQCKRCTEECPFGTLNEDPKGTPELNLTRCRRCGICLGACPERIISFKNYSVDIISSMVKAVNIPEEFEEKPRILAFLCENDAYPALDRAALNRTPISPWVRIIPVRCLGAVNIVWIADALSNGYDGILMLGCKSGDDYQCHYVRGSELMGTRGDNIKEKLTQLALEEERVKLVELSIDEWDRLPEVVNGFADEIEEIGMNPFKGF